MSKKDFRETWNVLNGAADTEVCNSSLRHVKCACCLRWSQPPGKPVALYHFAHRFWKGVTQTEWMCFTCAKSVFDINVDHLRPKYRRYYNRNQFAHVVEKIQRACRNQLAPPVAERFLELYHSEPPVEIPRALLLAVHEWLRRTG